MKKASLRIATNVMSSGRAYGYSVHNSGETASVRVEKFTERFLRASIL